MSMFLRLHPRPLPGAILVQNFHDRVQITVGVGFDDFADRTLRAPFIFDVFDPVAAVLQAALAVDKLVASLFTKYRALGNVSSFPL